MTHQAIPQLDIQTNADDLNQQGITLPGLDGSNPLGFLAALGVFKAYQLADIDARMKWVDMPGTGWRPALQVPEAVPATSISNLLLSVLQYGSASPSLHAIRHRKRFHKADDAIARLVKKWKKQKLSKASIAENKETLQVAAELSRTTWLRICHPALTVGDNTNVPAQVFRTQLETYTSNDSFTRSACDALAALGTELADENGIMIDTALRTMSGSGHQHFLRFASNLLANVETHHIDKTLFDRWRYDDPIRGLTLRLDPIEDARYAHRWDNPSTDSTRNTSGSVLAANALAVLGLSLIPTVPASNSARTVGFIGRGATGTYWRWPLWLYPIGVTNVTTLLRHPALVESPVSSPTLRQLGVGPVYQSQRLTVGKFRNFTPAQRIA